MLAEMNRGSIPEVDEQWKVEGRRKELLRATSEEGLWTATQALILCDGVMSFLLPFVWSVVRVVGTETGSASGCNSVIFNLV